MSQGSPSSPLTSAPRLRRKPSKKGGGEAYLLERATERVQLMIRKVFTLPDAGRPKDGGRLVVLPDTTTPLPREKPVPKPKVQTKWEQFAEKKGILKKKRSRMVYDEESESYKPRYGYGALSLRRRVYCNRSLHASPGAECHCRLNCVLLLQAPSTRMAWKILWWTASPRR